MAAMGKNTDPLSRHRSQYKCTTPPWKETYRKRCLERLKVGRKKFQDRFRQCHDQLASTSGVSDSKSSIVKDVMDEEWKRLSEEHGELPPWVPTKQSSTPFPGIRVKEREESELEQIINIMEEIQRELVEQEQAILAQYEESTKFEEAALCAALEGMRTDDHKYLCPVCGKNPLFQNKQVIFCACGIRIDTEYDAVDLSYVECQINEALTSHSDEGCTAKPEFIVTDVRELNVNNLMLQCKACHFLYIVL